MQRTTLKTGYHFLKERLAIHTGLERVKDAGRSVGVSIMNTTNVSHEPN
jgi:hypothetical protein